MQTGLVHVDSFQYSQSQRSQGDMMNILLIAIVFFHFIKFVVQNKIAFAISEATWIM